MSRLFLLALLASLASGWDRPLPGPVRAAAAHERGGLNPYHFFSVGQWCAARTCWRRTSKLARFCSAARTSPRRPWHGPRSAVFRSCCGAIRVLRLGAGAEPSAPSNLACVGARLWPSAASKDATTASTTTTTFTAVASAVANRRRSRRCRALVPAAPARAQLRRARLPGVLRAVGPRAADGAVLLGVAAAERRAVSGVVRACCSATPRRRRAATSACRRAGARRRLQPERRRAAVARRPASCAASIRAARPLRPGARGGCGATRRDEAARRVRRRWHPIVGDAALLCARATERTRAAASPSRRATATASTAARAPAPASSAPACARRPRTASTARCGVPTAVAPAAPPAMCGR